VALREILGNSLHLRSPVEACICRESKLH
jgi:hypothetical protein